jgi:hypothetical protein
VRRCCKKLAGVMGVLARKAGDMADPVVCFGEVRHRS